MSLNDWEINDHTADDWYFLDLNPHTGEPDPDMWTRQPAVQPTGSNQGEATPGQADTTDHTDRLLAARWTVVPNPDLDAWAVTANERGPADGGLIAVDVVWSRQVAEQIAADHNTRLDTPPPDEIGYAVRVTFHDGTSRIRHEDDPFTCRDAAERYAVNARRHRLVASAEVVQQGVWRGPWVEVP